MKLIIDIKVLDLGRATKFYADVLGLECRRKEKDWSAVLVGDAEIHLYKDGGATGDVEFYVKDIVSKVVSLKAKGVIFFSGIDKPNAIQVDKNNITTFPWGRTAFFNDSEGNQLALVQDD